jgi:hypothetical protein
MKPKNGSARCLAGQTGAQTELPDQPTSGARGVKRHTEALR